jgi:hypothetical protein
MSVIADRAKALEAALQMLRQYGLLLMSDPWLPSLVGMIVGEPLSKSWWGHPLGGVIYHVSNAVEEHPAVLTTKLLAGKVTYIHKRLWPAVFALGSAREPWQTDQLSVAARWLLMQTDVDSEVQTNDLLLVAGLQRRHLPKAARELERRLLVHATEIHTLTGAHAKVLETWPHWAERVAFDPGAVGLADAMRQLEDAATRLAAAGGTTTHAHLPWHF